jgi:hypothetical protein
MRPLHLGSEPWVIAAVVETIKEPTIQCELGRQKVLPIPSGVDVRRLPPERVLQYWLQWGFRAFVIQGPDVDEQNPAFSSGEDVANACHQTGRSPCRSSDALVL